MKRLLFPCGLVLLGSLVFPCSAPADCIDYGSRVHWAAEAGMPDRPLSVALSGDWAYVAARDSGLVVIDIADPSRPRNAARAATPAAALDVAAAGGFAFVAVGDSGLVVIDVADPALPRIVGRVRTTSPAVQVAVDGRYLYAGESKPGTEDHALEVIDLSNPSSPTLLGIVDVESMGDLAVADGRACVAGIGLSIYGGWCSLQIIDTTDPWHPRVAGGTELPNSPFSLGFGGIALSGSHVYVADGYYGLQVVDVAMTSAGGPRIVGSADTGDYWAISVSGTHAYAVQDANGGYLGEVHAIDVSDPTHPTVLATMGIPAWPDAVASRDSDGHCWAFVADGRDADRAGFHVYDFTGFRSPEVIGRYAVHNMCRRLDARGDQVYLTAYAEGLHVIDVSDPRNPALRTIVNTPGQVIDVAVSETTSGPRAILADGFSGVHLLDLGQWSPVIIGSLDLPGYAAAVAFSGDLAYVTEGPPSFLDVLNTIGPGVPRIVGQVEIPGRGSNVVVSDDRAYITIAEGLVAVDVADPASPRVLWKVETPGILGGVAVWRGYAYLAGTAGLQVVDITDFAAPRIVGILDTPGVGLISLAVVDGVLYAADCLDGLLVFEISEPTHPRVIGGLSNGHEALDVAVSGGHAFVSVGNRGLEIMPAQCAIRWPGTAAEQPPELMRPPRVVPNPCRGTLSLRLPAGGPLSVAIYDASGRRVRSLCAGPLDVGEGAHVLHTDAPLGTTGRLALNTGELLWDGLDESGRSVPGGVYFARVMTGAGTSATRFVLIR